MLVAIVCCFCLVQLVATGQEQKAETKGAEHAEKAAADASHTPAAHGADAHAGGHHDDTDLSHGNATASLASPADLRFDMSIYSFVVFLILLAVLYKFAWGPIATALDQREQTIARQIEEARLASEKGQSLLREYEAKLAAAMEEADRK